LRRLENIGNDRSSLVFDTPQKPKVGAIGLPPYDHSRKTARFGVNTCGAKCALFEIYLLKI
jgi:hypothetical protein